MRKFMLLLLAAGALTAQPVLDGVIDEGEWAKATTHSMTNGGSLKLLPLGEAVFIGVQMPSAGWGHVYVYDGESVRVIHVSAALGDVTYSKKGDVWDTPARFNWELREQQYSDTLRGLQDKYFEAHGWVGTNNNMSPGKFEIKLKRPAGGNFRLAAVFQPGSSQSFWPEALNDDTRNAKLISGRVLPSLKFDPSTWVEIR